MTDPVSLAATALAAGLSGVIAVLSWPRPPDVDGEFWFRRILVVLLRGEVEAAGGDRAAFESAVFEQVPLPDGSTADSVQDPAYDVLLGDPVDLPLAYDPKRWLATAGWDDLADWGAGRSRAVPEAILRRLPVHWVLLGPAGGSDTLDAFAERVGEQQIRIDADGLAVEQLEAAFIALPDDREYSFVFVGEGPGIQTALRALHASQGLRDRTVAVLSVDGLLGGAGGELTEADVDGWLAAHFSHRAFETEMDHPVPFFALRWSGSDPGTTRFPRPLEEPLVRDAIETVDLGALPRGADPHRVAKASMTLVACWALSRRG